jgi:hypothetical protein
MEKSKGDEKGRKEGAARPKEERKDENEFRNGIKWEALKREGECLTFRY